MTSNDDDEVSDNNENDNNRNDNAEMGIMNIYSL